MRNEYRTDRLVATVFVLATVAFMAASACGMYTQACVKQKLIRERTQEHVSLWVALNYPDAYFTQLDIIEIPAEEEPKG